MNRLVWIFFAILVIASNIEADEARPVYVEVEQIAESEFLLKWKIPPVMAAIDIPTIKLNHKQCSTEKQLVTVAGPALLGKTLYHCEEAQSGFSVTIDYPRTNPALTSLVVFKSLSDSPQQIFSGPEVTSIAVGPKVAVTSVSRQYIGAGITHILIGIDHLLFVLCLMVIASTFKRLVLTVTGFTIAHSITLSLATLKIVEVRTEVVETLIALSILLLAAEIVKHQRSPHYDSFTWRHPVAASSVFGLLHGFGFAVVLQELGLPQTMKLEALLFFNIGVELGQLLFIFAVLGVSAVILKLVPKTEDYRYQIVQLGIYMIGVCSAFWLFSRSAFLMV